ncbi:YSIRK-type signal peptide-containing protein, partial [Staphylococcus hyicus]|uniref:YSIRK-type signal peptide-containing protein n=1 Tax=Staphylococcus hyicus TaxID=1284 RepID=UPI0024739B8D
MKNLDFLPNKQNKYAIRKYTVGTTSILLGAFLLLGTDDEAQAAENTTADATTALASEPSSQPTPPTAVAPDTTISPVSDNVTTATATTIPETVPTASTTSTVAPTQPVAAPTATPTATGTSTSTTTPSNTSASVSTTRLATQPTTTLAAATTTGTNVNDLVTVSNAAISKTAIDPNQSGNFRLTANYTV